MSCNVLLKSLLLQNGVLLSACILAVFLLHFAGFFLGKLFCIFLQCDDMSVGSWPGWGRGEVICLLTVVDPLDISIDPSIIIFTTCMLDILLMFNVAQVHFLSSTFTLIYTLLPLRNILHAVFSIPILELDFWPSVGIYLLS